MRIRPATFCLIRDHFKTQEMCIEAVEVDPWELHDVPDHFKALEICDEALREDPFFLWCVPDWFLTQEQVKIWHDNDDYCNDDELIERYDAYKKRKAQKTKIKRELISIAWHATRMQDWHMTEDEEKRITEMFA